MVLKKDLLNDLKKSNRELEKHLANINVEGDFIEGLMESPKLKPDSETINLLSSEIIDLRTEVSLLRKNLSVDVENMVLKQVQTSQQKFIVDMNNFYSKILIELKQNFAGYVNDINEEINKVRSEVASFKAKDNSVEDQLGVIKNELQDFKNEIITNSNSKASLDLKVNTKLDFIGDKFLEISNEMVKKNSFLEKNIVNVNKRLIEIENKFTTIDTLIKDEKVNFEEQLNVLNDNTKNLKKQFSSYKQTKEKDSIKKIEEKIKNDSKWNSSKFEKFNTSNIEKILDIDKRLEKLQSLK